MSIHISIHAKSKLTAKEKVGTLRGTPRRHPPILDPGRDLVGLLGPHVGASRTLLPTFTAKEGDSPPIWPTTILPNFDFEILLEF